MENTSLNVKTVIGKRVFVKKESLDVGGMNVTPAMNEGERNRGEIIDVGQIGVILKFRGIKKGAKIIFNKYFAPNYIGGNDNLVFVEIENIMAVE